MLPAKSAILIALNSVRIVFFVFHRRIITLFADCAGHRKNFSHRTPTFLNYATISVTMPEPTVLPPSRTAKRKP
jgi:hypothetical protein